MQFNSNAALNRTWYSAQLGKQATILLPSRRPVAASALAQAWLPLANCAKVHLG